MRDGWNGTPEEVTTGQGSRPVSRLFFALGATAGLAALLAVLLVLTGQYRRAGLGLAETILPLTGMILPLALGAALALAAARRFQTEYSLKLMLVHLAVFAATIGVAGLNAIVAAHITFLVISDRSLSMGAVLIGMLMPFAGLVIGAGMQAGTQYLRAALGMASDTGKLPVVQMAIRTAGFLSLVEGLLLAMAILFRGLVVVNTSAEILAYCLIASLPVFAYSATSNAGELGRNPALKWVIRLVLGYSGCVLGVLGAFLIINTIAYATASNRNWVADWNFMVVFVPFLLIIVLIIGMAAAVIGIWLYMLSLKRL
jgi:hypothetical protein